ncbi:MAG: L-rhamnose mutarotase [Rhizobiales bacterium]|nr:L-rhamnose mutarotase [Hyphomicrobiales bacterium]
MRRMGMLIGVKPDKIAEYTAYHAAVWPEVLAMISACNISNYTIFLREPENLLFGVWEYHGEDFDADMEKMSQHEPTRRWWAMNTPCQEPLTSRAPGEHWAMMQEIFHLN